MALHVAAATLQSRRRLEDVPQRFGARLTVGREVIQGGDEFVPFVWETVGLVSLRNRLHVHVLPALPLIGIQNLVRERGGGFLRNSVLNIFSEAKHSLAKADCECKIPKSPQPWCSYLEYSWNLICLSSVHISLCDWPYVKQFTIQVKN